MYSLQDEESIIGINFVRGIYSLDTVSWTLGSPNQNSRLQIAPVSYVAQPEFRRLHIQVLWTYDNVAY